MSICFEHCAELLKENSKSFIKMQSLNKEMYNILNKASSIDYDEEDSNKSKNIEQTIVYFD
jgi:hypothetical protein